MVIIGAVVAKSISSATGIQQNIRAGGILRVMKTVDCCARQFDINGKLASLE